MEGREKEGMEGQRKTEALEKKGGWEREMRMEDGDVVCGISYSDWDLGMILQGMFRL